MSNYPEYACSCCGVTNGDMFYDWLQGREATDEEQMYFKAYRQAWQQLKEERDRAKATQYHRTVWSTTPGRKLSDETRAKISATKRGVKL